MRELNSMKKNDYGILIPRQLWRSSFFRESNFQLQIEWSSISFQIGIIPDSTLIALVVLVLFQFNDNDIVTISIMAAQNIVSIFILQFSNHLGWFIGGSDHQHVAVRIETQVTIVFNQMYRTVKLILQKRNELSLFDNTIRCIPCTYLETSFAIPNIFRFTDVASIETYTWPFNEHTTPW